MNTSTIIKHISQTNEKLKQLHTGNSLLYQWYDFLKAYVVYGCLPNQYCRGGFYKIKGCERKKQLTYRHMLEAFKACNSHSVQHLLENKEHFNRHFSPFVRRKWIMTKNSSIEDFEALCASCDSIMVKPLEGVEGHGIYKITPPL